MPLPDALARFNRIVTNRLARPVAGRVPPMAVVVHRGRRSGRTYRTPVLAFRDGPTWTIALTYGPDRDWVRNVLAAGGCTLAYAGRSVELRDPRIVGEAGRERMPRAVRRTLHALDVTAFLELTES